MDILASVIKARNGHYCHALECTYPHEIENAIESIHNECVDATKQDLIDFFSSIEIYFLQEDELCQEQNDRLENELYAFNLTQFIDNNY